MSDSKLVLGNKTYDRIKWTTMILLPASGAMYFGLGEIWGFPNTEQVVGTIAVISTFLGALIGISSKAYNSEAAMDGRITASGEDPNTGLPNLQMTITKSPDELLSNETVRLKVEKDR